jgi:flagellar biosynthesis GTPase FlhF
VSAQRFIGASSREAMNQVRLALGEDALILSSRMTDDGVEIMAQVEDIQNPLPLLEWLLAAGFSASMSEALLDRAPTQLPDATPARLKAWLMQRLDSQLNQLDNEAELFDGATVIALVGPTGVGKTTTTAKLAARYVMRHGPGDVALVTTDSFRIGAHEQLSIYAQLLGVDLHAVGPDAPLGPLLGTLASKRLVIIDTVGMSQRDQRLLTHIQQLGASDRCVRLMLVLNAASHGDTLDEVVHTYREAAHAARCRLDDCIISKCDEAARLGPVLDCVMRHGLRLNYLSMGQQVPEDLQLPGASNILQQALDSGRPSRFTEPAGKSTGPQLDALVRGLLGQRKALLALRDSLAEHIQPPLSEPVSRAAPAAQGGRRVVYQGEPHRLSSLAGQAEGFGSHALRYRNRHARLTLRHLPLVHKGTALRAWFGTLQDSHSGQRLGQRYWLADAHGSLNEQAADLVQAVKHEELKHLTERGSALLLDLHPHLPADLRLHLATGLAATAVRLTHASEDWAFQARAQLLGLLPKKPKGHASELLDGLLYLSAATSSL